MAYKTILSLSAPQVNFRTLHLPGVFSTNIYSRSRRKLISVPCNFLRTDPKATHALPQK
jgi:hypothetical protein